MKKINLLYSILLVTILLLLLNCSGITKVADAITNPSARQLYAREFKDNQLALDSWESAFKKALQDSLVVKLPYGEKGIFMPGRHQVHSYNFRLEEGEVLVAKAENDSVSHRVFIDIYEQKDSLFERIESSKINSNSLAFAAQKTGNYKIIIQPELLANTNFFISLVKEPLYDTFPVAGKGNAAIGSFWGMERDGGSRTHEGIDIFAKKGTPVVAVTEGMVTYTGEKGLGGKQVWLRDGNYGSSLYYAHLDSINIISGSRVALGDTLGFVGNTGNAKFTPPHLHFGIYRGYGAVNPLPFVFSNEKIADTNFSRTLKSDKLLVKNAVVNLRLSPDAKSKKIGELKMNDKLSLLGEHNDWLHVQALSGLKAYIHKTLIKEEL